MDSLDMNLSMPIGRTCFEGGGRIGVLPPPYPPISLLVSLYPLLDMLYTPGGRVKTERTTDSYYSKIEYSTQS